VQHYGTIENRAGGIHDSGPKHIVSYRIPPTIENGDRPI
jgi:hypothetical protein